MADLLHYCDSPYHSGRRRTREVPVGSVVVGGDQPVRVQSMTIAHTWDVEATIEETLGLVEAGCEIVRMTVASRKDAAALAEIVRGTRERGCDVPFVADIHYSPANAMAAVEVVEKVRINPGNYVDKKKFDAREIEDSEFEEARRQVEEAFVPLVRRAKERGVALRVGVNHGSLADRMVNRYGDSPLGMVESALEYLRICVAQGFHDIIISMKSSNPIVMIQAYRLLVARMNNEDMDFPLHLGVTEAGEGREGRVKSAVGIGALLEDGIGDTVRVSLTEDAAKEVPVARALAERLERRGDRAPAVPRTAAAGRVVDDAVDPFTFRRRRSRRVVAGGVAYGGAELPRVEASLGSYPECLAEPGGDLDLGVYDFGGDRYPELVEIEIRSREALDQLLERVRPIAPRREDGLPAVSIRIRAAAFAEGETVDAARIAAAVDRVSIPWEAGRDRPDLGLELARAGACVLMELPPWDGDVDRFREALLDLAQPLVEAGASDVMLGFRIRDTYPAAAPVRLARVVLDSMGIDFPFVLIDVGGGDPTLDTSVRLGSCLCDGVGDAIRIECEGLDREIGIELSYDILQATRVRTSKAEFISCPSCGRTLFDLESTSRKIRDLTGHLKGVKIGVMGCLVNGPGEMADADFGYVGWKVGRVNLYVGQDCVVENVPEEEAGDRLVELIKEHGRWVDPPVTVDA